MNDYSDDEVFDYVIFMGVLSIELHTGDFHRLSVWSGRSATIGFGGFCWGADESKLNPVQGRALF